MLHVNGVSETPIHPGTQGTKVLRHQLLKAIGAGAPESSLPHCWAWQLLEDRESPQKRMEVFAGMGTTRPEVRGLSGHQLWLFQEVTFEEPPEGRDTVGL